MKKVLALGGISAPLMLVASNALGGCGLDEGGLFIPSDEDGAADVQGGDVETDATWADAVYYVDAADAADSNETGLEASADAPADAPADVVDAGPIAGLSNDADKNNCIHWLTEKLGTTLAYDADNHTCLTKPLSSIPVGPSQTVYVWSKDATNNDRIGFSTAVNPKNYYVKCSSYSLPPNKAEMESEVFTGGYVSTSNAASLPDVVLNSGSCSNGSAFIINLAP